MAEIFNRLMYLRILTKEVCAPSQTAFLRGRYSPAIMSSPVLTSSNSVSHPASYLLALALTPGLGPTRVRKLVEHFGSAERVFHASLTELEATGMPVVSAQSLATGKSMELAQTGNCQG